MFICKEPGHSYTLETLGLHPLGLPPRQELDFVQKKNVAGDLLLRHNGTTTEEVILVLIDRLEFLEKELPHVENVFAIDCLQGALDALDRRTGERLERGVEGTALE